MKRITPIVVLAFAALSIAAANPASTKNTDTPAGFCKALEQEGIGVHPGLKQMKMEFEFLQTNYNRMKAARQEATAMESSPTSSDSLKADTKRRAFESEHSFREDVNKFAAKFAK